MRADGGTESAVLAVLGRFVDCYTRRDIEGIASLFVNDPDLLLYGSGSDEKRIGIDEIRAQMKRDWAQSESVSFRITWNSVSMAGSVAWVGADGIVHAEVKEHDVIFPFRITAVLEKREDRWLFAQWHGSIPLPAQSEGESFPA
jgi:ketosteroid isomerase-like protein